MKTFKILLSLILISSLTAPAFARPGELVEKVLERYNIQGLQPYAQSDYLSYKVTSSKFVSQPTLFLKLGAKGVVLEQNFLFDKNTVHEKDVQRAKQDSLPTVAIPNQAYLVGDFSQLPRESFDTKSKVIGAFSAPLGAAAGTIVGGGKGLIEGTKIGVKTADAASRALGGDVSGKAGAWASSATAVATGAITGLFAGFTGGAVEGSVRGARVAIEGVSGADMKITEATSVVSSYAVIGGRIGKELTPDEQKDLLNSLSKLEQARLANEGIDTNKDLSDLPKDDSSDNSKGFLSDLDSAQDKAGFDSESNYPSEDAVNKNVVGMW